MSNQTSDAGKRVLGRVRKARIAEMIRTRGFMSSGDLAEEFGVSEMTVRRDLAELHMKGELTRTHGGAVAAQEQAAQAGEAVEPLFDERRKRSRREKMAIAVTAEQLIRKGQAIALDVGTTTYELALRLAKRKDIKMFTNNLRIASLLGAHAAEIYLLGGQVRHEEMSLCGPVATEQAKKLWFDIAFIGVSSLSAGGIFDYSLEETEIKRIFLEQATHKVVLCDSSKFGLASLVQVCRLDGFDTLITDAKPPSGLQAALTVAGVNVMVASE